VCDAMEWKSGLSTSRREAPQFHWVIGAVTVAAVAINFLGVNPIHALILAGLVQGFLAPGMIILLLLITGNHAVMGRWTNSRPVAVLGWLSAAATAAAALGLVRQPRGDGPLDQFPSGRRPRLALRRRHRGCCAGAGGAGGLLAA